MFADDLVGLAENGRHADSADAVTVLTAYRLPLDALAALLRHDPKLQFDFLCKACHELRAAQRHAVLLRRRDARGRVAIVLQMLRQHQIDMGLPPRAPIAVPMPRIDIADYTALTPEAISRAFADLERRDYIMVARDRSVTITDEAAFAALVSGDVARPHAIAAG